MTNGYENQKKLSFFKRMWNNLFHKTKMLEAPLEYTQREIRVKIDNIIDFLKTRRRIYLKGN